MPWPVRKLNLNSTRPVFLSSLLLFAVLLPALCLSLHVQAVGLSGRSWQELNSAPGVTTDYTASFTIDNSATIGSLSFLLCSNSPLQEDVCDIPGGLDVTGAQLTAQSGITDFSLFLPEVNNMVLSRTPSVITAPLTVTLTFHDIVNPTDPGSYYVRLGAYSSSDATGTAIDYGGLAFAITSNLQISSYVPPYLTFCSAVTITAFDCSSASGDYINFGELDTAHSRQADSQLLVATNAPNGYVMQVYGTTMTSGNNVIAAITNGVGSQPGVSQFGINLRANSVPSIGANPTGPGTGSPVAGYNTPNQYRFVSNDVVASSLTADNFRKYTASYIINTGSAQPAGTYVSTLTYVAAGSF